MIAHANIDDFGPDRFRNGLVRAFFLHAIAAGVIIALAFFAPEHIQHWGENSSQMGAIQASMVSAIPLPREVPPVKNSVLASDNVTPVPKPPPKEATQPPPKPTDVLIKEKTVEKPPKVAPVRAEQPPKHPQPTPPTPKAASGAAATELPESITQLQHGTAMAAVTDRVFGNRYAYYVQIVSRTVANDWYTQEADPRTSQGKRATVIFDINRDGTPSNIRLEGTSGSPSLDESALHAVQRVDSFGPLPAGDHITVEYTFIYQQP